MSTATVVQTVTAEQLSDCAAEFGRKSVDFKVALYTYSITHEDIEDGAGWRTVEGVAITEGVSAEVLTQAYWEQGRALVIAQNLYDYAVSNPSAIRWARVRTAGQSIERCEEVAAMNATELAAFLAADTVTKAAGKKAAATRTVKAIDRFGPEQFTKKGREDVVAALRAAIERIEG